MALAMGSIMAVVAELLNHMDREEDVIIIPKINLKKKTHLFTGDLAGEANTAAQSNRVTLLTH